MSQDAYVFFNRELRSIAEWQKAIDALGFALTLASDHALAGRKGYLPAWLDGREAGFECCMGIDVAKIRQVHANLDFGGPWSSGMACYNGSFTGCAATWVAIAAWTNATDGLAFDPQTGAILTGKAAVRYAKDALIELSEVERQFAAIDWSDFRAGRRRGNR